MAIKDKDRKGDRQRSFRLSQGDLDWIDETARRLDGEPDRIGRVSANDVLRDIVRRAREAKYGETQGT